MIGVIICKVQDNEEIRKGISSYLLSNILKNKMNLQRFKRKVKRSITIFRGMMPFMIL